MPKKIVIVGGVAGGASTAARLRRLNEHDKIVIFEKGEYISFANCGLPYYIGNVIKDREKLIVQSVESMSKRYNIDIRIWSEVINIDINNKVVTIRNHKLNETYSESYDVLVLSPGASPIVPPIPGINEADNVFTIRNIPDTDAVKQFLEQKKPKRAVIIGGGFIGLEMAENLHESMIDVTIVEMAKQVMAPLDFEMASIVHNYLLDKNVTLILEDGVKAFAKNGKQVILNSGRQLEADIIILAIGVKPETGFLINTGLTLNERKAIVVNEYMQTSNESIYAVGDAVEIKDYINNQPTMIPLAWPANRQGRLVADNICGQTTKYSGTLGSAVAKVFDLTVASTGNNEKQLQKLNIDYKVIHTHSGSHAGYYPNASPIALKLIFKVNDGRILGAQAVGFEGVEKRIDVIATAIKGKLTVYDLPAVELCYAPPFSSAKDPVNMAGYVAQNILNGLVDTIQWYEIDDIITRDEFILDVREPNEKGLGRLANSYNIPLGQLRERIEEIPKDKVIYVYCQVGLRGYVACRILLQYGFKCKNIDGGFKTYGLVKGINGDKGEGVIKNRKY